MGPKEEALSKRRAEDKVMYTENFSKYSFCASYEELMEIIKKYKVPRICEYVFEALPVNFFYDIDIKEKTNPKEFKNYKEIVHDIIDKTTRFFEDRGLPVIVIVLKSPTKYTAKKNNDQKKSFHMIFRAENQVFSIPCCISITNYLWKDSDYMKKGIIDKSVLREGNFRSYLCSKKDEVRPFVRCKSFGSQNFEDVDTFVQHYSEDAKIWTEKDLSIPENHTKDVAKRKAGFSTGKGDLKGKAKKIKVSSSSTSSNPVPEILHKFILEKYGFSTHDLSACTKKDDGYFFNITSTKYCHIKGGEHKSNGQFIYINSTESAQMCHDKVDCSRSKHGNILAKDFPNDLRILFNLPVMSKIPCETKAIENIKEIVLREYDDKTVSTILYDKPKNMFHGPADMKLADRYFSQGCIGGCKIEHQVFHDGFHIKCSMCQKTFPNSGLITWKKELYPSLHQQFNLTINNTIINNYNNTPTEDDFSCNVSIDESIFNNQSLTALVNRILDGHKVILISDFLHRIEKDFVYSNQDWYHFNSSIWNIDKEEIQLKKRILRFIDNFHKVKQFYTDQPAPTEIATNIIKNVHGLISKMSKIGFMKEIVEGAKLFYIDDDFVSLLNSKKHLLPFTNGVFDLLTKEFRPAKKDDYIFLTTGYAYDPNVCNPEVSTFLEQVLPEEDVRDYVLKRFADCLNGDFPNTLFSIFIGVGANGKTQLINLLYYTMGEFGVKIDSTLFTRKRTDANSATPVVLKMRNMRMVYLSEPELNESLHMSLIKELTGEESNISARDLHKGLVEFPMEGKFFLVTNELPEVNGADEANWRRIKVIDFPSKFVDYPRGNEFKKDRTLPSRLKADVTLRQTFMNLLLSRYYKPEPEQEPNAVSRRTNDYRAENNEVEQWVLENIEFTIGGILELTDLNTRRFGPDYDNRKIKGQFRKEVEKVLKKIGNNVEGFNHCILNTGGSKKWKGITLII